MNRNWHVLCHDIGHRTAGSAGEQQAADYIESRLRRVGLENVQQLPFEFPHWTSSACSMKVSTPRSRRPARRMPSVRAGIYSVATPAGGVRGPLAYLQSGLPLDFEQPLKGKIGLLIGTFAIADEQVKQRVVRSGLKAIITVDMRVPFAWPTSSGAAPHWVEGFDIPMVGLPYLEAIKLVEQMPLNAHLTVSARCFPGRSQNVLGEIPGRDTPDDVIIVSGHHDCVEENVGADDNGSGVIFMLELARLFSGSSPQILRKSQFSDLFGKAGREFLEALVAEDDVTLRVSTKRTLKGHLELLCQVRQQIAAVTHELRRQVMQDPDAELWRTLPGIGWVLAYTIMAEVGRLDRFKNGRHLSSYSVLSPRSDDTGDEDPDKPPKGRHVGHAGRLTLKWAFIEAAHAAIRKSPRLKAMFDRRTDEGKRDCNRGYILVGHELCRVGYSCVKNKRSYSEQPPPRPGCGGKP